MSLNSLLRRKTRTVLTILGVVIGTASIVIMISLGIAMDQSFKEDLASMGSLNIIEINAGYYEGPSGVRPQEQAKLDDKAVADFEAIPGVQAVMPQKNYYMKIAAGKMLGQLSIIGVRPQDLSSFDFEMEEGRLLLPSDKNALIFGKQVAYSFYNPRLANHMGGPPSDSGKPPVNLMHDKLMLTSDMEYGERRREPQETNIKPPKPHPVKGVGLIKESNSEKDYSAYMNLQALEEIQKEDLRSTQEEKSRRRTQQGNKYDNIKVKVVDIEQVQAVQEKIKAMGFQTYSLTDMLESMKKTSRTMQAVLGGIGAVSLLVAAIGITNTMVMSIYERTREIGIMKVLGADMADIKRLFLLEAGLIGFGGGLIGLALSYGGSVILNKVAAPALTGGMEGEAARAISVITPELALLALVFATFIGIISGYAPARRAMNLSALEAIRNE